MSILKKMRKLFLHPQRFVADHVKKKRNQDDNAVEKESTKKKSAKKSNFDFPEEFDLYNENILETDSHHKVYGYIPWIAGHGTKLVSQICRDSDLEIKEIRLFLLNKQNSRKNIIKFSHEHPYEYKYFLTNRLIQIKDRLSGIICTFDWNSAMRLIVEVCQELGITTILIPHEGIFLNRQKYYYDTKSYASVPICDIALVWGHLQKEIFIERGYPEERIVVVGSPKLDTSTSYKAVLNRKQFCLLYGFNPEVPIILFACQYFDSQTDQKKALNKQKEIIKDLMEYCEDHQYQLLIRLPPSGYDILGKSLYAQLGKKPYSAIDDSICYQTGPEESIFHSEFVLSINSTMLLEAYIMGRKSISTRYINIESIWDKNLIPCIDNKESLFQMLNDRKHQNIDDHEAEYKKVKYDLSTGEFDGQARKRIQKILRSIAVGEKIISKYPQQIESLLEGNIIDVICIPSAQYIIESKQKYLKSLLRCNTLLNADSLKNSNEMSSVNLFIQWGIESKDVKIIQREIARKLRRPIAYIEDGFIRSYGIGLSNEPGCSIIIDDMTAYYDATKPSRLETYLASDSCLTEEDRNYCRRCIDKIINYRLSKYNDTPIFKPEIGQQGRKKLLLVDQRYGDMSVVYGLANDQTFKSMLSDALKNYSEWDIIIKVHPDAIKGGKSSYFNMETLKFAKHKNNIFIIDYDINPYCLFDIVDEVFVCSSQLGFEACMAGKQVHCYGMPFYAGWGITNDKIKIDRRNKKRDILEIFYFSYVKLSRYVDPTSGTPCKLEEFIELMHENVLRHGG